MIEQDNFQRNKFIQYAEENCISINENTRFPKSFYNGVGIIYQQGETDLKKAVEAIVEEEERRELAKNSRIPNNGSTRYASSNQIPTNNQDLYGEQRPARVQTVPQNVESKGQYETYQRQEISNAKPPYISGNYGQGAQPMYCEPTHFDNNASIHQFGMQAQPDNFTDFNDPFTRTQPSEYEAFGNNQQRFVQQPSKTNVARGQFGDEFSMPQQQQNTPRFDDYNPGIANYKSGNSYENSDALFVDQDMIDSYNRDSILSNPRARNAMKKTPIIASPPSSLKESVVTDKYRLQQHPSQAINYLVIFILAVLVAKIIL